MIRESKLNMREKWLITCLLDYAGDSEWSYPTQMTLARDMSLSVDRVRRIIAESRQKELIETRPRGRQIEYKVLFDRIETPAASNSNENQTPVVSNRSDRVPATGESQNTGCQQHTEHPLFNIHKNTNGNGGLKTKTIWTDGGIKESELREPKSVEKRFKESLARNYCMKADRLRFHTLARYCAFAKNSTNPGGLFTSLLRKKDWKGTNADEDAVRESLKDLDAPDGRIDRLGEDSDGESIGEVLQSITGVAS